MSDKPETYPVPYIEQQRQAERRNAPLSVHVIHGELKLSLAAEKARLEAELAAMTAERDGWKALAQAERIAAEANRFGLERARECAYAAVLAAREALRALGIDPNA